MKGKTLMDNISLNVFFGERVQANEAAAVSVDLLCATLVFWVRKLESNTGDRYFKKVMGQLEDIYMEPGEDDPDILMINHD